MRPSAKHRLFAKYLADGLSQTDAYIKAGFSPKGASANATKLIQRNHSISQWRDEHLAERAKVHETAMAQQVVDKKRTLDALIDDLYAIKDGAMAAIAVLDNKGVPIGEYRSDWGNAIKAVVALGQQQFGAFVAKSQAVAADPRDQWTDEQVRRLQDLADG